MHHRYVTIQQWSLLNSCLGNPRDVMSAADYFQPSSQRCGCKDLHLIYIPESCLYAGHTPTSLVASIVVLYPFSHCIEPATDLLTSYCVLLTAGQLSVLYQRTQYGFPFQLTGALKAPIDNRKDLCVESEAAKVYLPWSKITISSCQRQTLYGSFIFCDRINVRQDAENVVFVIYLVPSSLLAYK